VRHNGKPAATPDYHRTVTWNSYLPLTCNIPLPAARWHSDFLATNNSSDSGYSLIAAQPAYSLSLDQADDPRRLAGAARLRWRAGRLGKGNKLGNDAEKKAANEFKGELDAITKFIPPWVKVAIALALGCGTTVGWKRIVVTVGEKIGKSHLTYAQGASAELVAMSTIAAADLLGLPVSGDRRHHGGQQIRPASGRPCAVSCLPGCSPFRCASSSAHCSLPSATSSS
jgi:hypothetical protein